MHMVSISPRETQMTPDARIQAEADQLEARWRDDPRWSGVERTYAAADVVRLRGSVVPEHTLARHRRRAAVGAPAARASRCARSARMTGGQAVQMVKAGLEAIYLSGWQVAADANLRRCRRIPTRASIRRTACPQLVKRLNNALMRADQIDWSEGRNGTHWSRRSSPTPRPASAGR